MLAREIIARERDGGMKTTWKWIAAFAVLASIAFEAPAEILDDTNWADEVVEWGGNVQNYGLHATPELMDGNTTWWLLGAPDADVNGNGEAFDSCDQDSVAGWRNCGAGDVEWFTLRYDAAITDGEGDDLRVVTYGGPYGEAAVYASTDGDDFVLLDTIGAGTPGILVDYWIDFDGQIDNVCYVKLLHAKTGPLTGRFFDAVGGLVRSVPRIPGDTNNDGDVDESDAATLAANWGATVSNGWSDGDFNGDKTVNCLDASILAANWTGARQHEGATTDSVPEPTALPMLLAIVLAELSRRRPS
jgi:hypothetical protein